MSANNFIKLWLILFIIFMSFVVFINILIDPYGLWNTSRIESLNKLKPAAATRNRLVKPHQLKNFNAKTLIMGNSRPEMGLDPDSACWPDGYKPLYNQAIPGVNLYQQFRLLQHATFFHKPTQIILGIDFVDFLYKEPAYQVIWPPKKDIKNLSVKLDGKENSRYQLSVVLDQLTTTLSLDAFSDSLLTIFSQSDPFSSNRTEAGFNTANDYKKIIATEGQAVLFLQKNIEMIKRLNRPMYLFNEKDWSQSFEVYRQLLKYSKEKDINVIVFINPYHSDYIEVIRQTDHWKQFIEWKKKIAQTTLGFENVALWDFALINKYTTEPLQGQGKTKARLKWFWEPAHYNKDYGELMISQMLDVICQKNTKVPSIGIKITDIVTYSKELNHQELESNSRFSVLGISDLLKKQKKQP